MPRFSERRQDDDSYHAERGWRRDEGPWSPYNGSKRPFDRSHARDERRFDSRGRDYWRENEDESPREWYEGGDFSRDRDDFGRRDFSRRRERWDDRRSHPPDDWSYREHLHDPITEGEPSWGNEMGLGSDQPSGRSIPRGPDWQSEPHPSEAWIARDDRYRERPSPDDRMREAAGEQYPSRRSWHDEDEHDEDDRDVRDERDWRGRGEREAFSREQRDVGRDMREREERDMRDREQRGYARDMRGGEQRGIDRDMRGGEQRDLRGDYGRDMRDREQRDVGRDMRGSEQRGYGRDMREREERAMRGGEQRGYGRDMREREEHDMRDREQRGYARDMRDREQRGYARDMRDREQRGIDRDMRGGEPRGIDRDMRGGEQRGLRRDIRRSEQRDLRGDVRDRGREYGPDTGARRDFGRERDMRGPRDYEAREREQRDLRDRERREYRDMRDDREQRREARDQRRYADEPGRDLGSFEGDHGRWTRREYDVDNHDVRADESHELRRDRGEPWHGSETRGSDEYGRGLEQRSPEDRFRAENREWAARISGSDRSRHR